MKFIDNILKNIKGKRETKRKLEKIKQDSYIEAMEQEAKEMGKKQAELEKQHRIEVYENRLKNQRDRTNMIEKQRIQIERQRFTQSKPDNFDWVSPKLTGKQCGF